MLFQPLLATLVEPVTLVEQEHPGPGRDEARDESRRFMPAENVQTRCQRALGSTAAARRRGRPPMVEGSVAEGQVLGGGQVLVHVRAVGDEPDLTADGSAFFAQS